MESKISKYDLRIGNMFEQGIVWKISGRSGAKVHLHGKGKWYKGFRSEVDVDKLKPILLTPEVLVEWCGFNDGGNKQFLSFYKSEFPLAIKQLPNKFMYYIGGVDFYITYLHELQNLYKAITGKELEIKG